MPINLGPPEELLRCENCQQNAGYYERTGKDYVFRCLYCGIEQSAHKTKPAGSVLELTHCNGITQHIIFRKRSSPEAVRHMIRPHRHSIIYAELRSTAQQKTVTAVILPRRLLRTCIAKMVYLYLWLYNFVIKFLYWRFHGKTKR